MGRTKTDASSGKKLDRRVIKTRRAIEAAFESLLMKRDIKKITISAIAEEADIDRKTFYLHYSSIEDLLDHIAAETAETVVNSLVDNGLFSPEGPDMSAIVTSFNDLISENLPLHRRVVQSLSSDDILKLLKHPLESALVEAERTHGLTSDPYLSYYIRFFVGGVLAVYEAWLTSDRDIPIEEIADITSRASLYGFEGLMRDR